MAPKSFTGGPRPVSHIINAVLLILLKLPSGSERGIFVCFTVQVRLENVAILTGSVMMVPVFSAHGDVMEQETAWTDLMRWTAVCALLI